MCRLVRSTCACSSRGVHAEVGDDQVVEAMREVRQGAELHKLLVARGFAVVASAFLEG